MDDFQQPIIPPINPDLGNPADMELGDITKGYEKIGSQFIQAGQASIRDVAARQRQLIGSDFSTPGEGPMGDYNESTYLGPVVSSAASGMRTIGTQVALQEGMRRGEEAAKQRLENAQKAYNDWVAEQQRKAAEAAQRAAQQAQLGSSNNVTVDSFDRDFLKSKGLTIDDISAMDANARERLFSENYYYKAGVGWDYQGKDWYAAVDATYKHFGVTGKDARDERSGNQSSSNKAFWDRADVGDYFKAQYLNKYAQGHSGFSSGAAIVEDKKQYMTQMNQAIETWINPKTEAEKQLSFDEVFRAVEVKIPVFTQAGDRERGYTDSERDYLLRRITQFAENTPNGGKFHQNYDEIMRERERLNTGEAVDVVKLEELVSKSSTGLTEPVPALFGKSVLAGPSNKYVTTNAASIMAGVLDLTNEDLINMKKWKNEDPEEFKAALETTSMVMSRELITVSDGNNNSQSRYFDKKSGKYKVAPAGEFIVHATVGSADDKDLQELQRLLRDRSFIDAVQEEPDGRQAKALEKLVQKVYENQIAGMYIGQRFGVTPGRSLYNAANYDSNNYDTGRLKIKGKEINDHIKEFKKLINSGDKKKANAMFRDLIAKANKQNGYFLTVGEDGAIREISLKGEDGKSEIGAKNEYFNDYSIEEAAALQTVLLKEMEAGNLDGKWLASGEGTGFNLIPKAAGSIQKNGRLLLAATGFLSHVVDPNDNDLFTRQMLKVIDNREGNLDYNARRAEEAYNNFSGLLDLQFTTSEGHEKWLGHKGDGVATTKRVAGDLGAFAIDVIATAGAGAIAKKASLATAQNITARLVVNSGKAAGDSLLERAAANVAKKSGGSAAEKLIAGNGIRRRDASGRFIKGADGKPATMTFDEIGQGLARTAVNGDSLSAYLKNIDGTLFKGIGEVTAMNIVKNAMSAPGMHALTGLSRTLRLMSAANRDTAGFAALTTAGISAGAIRRASPASMRAAVRILAEPASNLSSSGLLKGVVKASVGKGAKTAEVIAAEKAAGKAAGKAAALESKQLAKALVEHSAKMTRSGKPMTSRDVIRYLARETGEGALRRRAILRDFIDGEIAGNALFGLYEVKSPEGTGVNSRNPIEDPSYMTTQIIGGTAMTATLLGLGRGFRIASRATNSRRLARAQKNLALNSQDINSAAYKKAVSSLAKASIKADKLSTNAMDHAFTDSGVAKFRKLSEEAQEAVDDQLAKVMKGIENNGVETHVGDALINQLNAKIGYGHRYLVALQGVKNKAMMRLPALRRDMPRLAALDAKASAKITAEAHEAVVGLSLKDARETAVKVIAKNLGGGAAAEREASTLLRIYDEYWDKALDAARKGLIDINSYGGQKRALYLSPAGITSTPDDGIELVYKGIVSEKKMNYDVSDAMLERNVDFGQVARQYYDRGTTAKKSNGMNIRNPEGFNLVDSLHIYANRLEHDINLSTIERAAVKNRDMMIVGRHNMANAIAADRAYYENLLKVSESVSGKLAKAAKGQSDPAVAKAAKELEALNKELLQAKTLADKLSKEAAGSTQATPRDMTAKYESGKKAKEVKFKAYLSDSAAKMAARQVGTTPEQFQHAYSVVLRQFAKNKRDVLAGNGRTVKSLNNFTRDNGDYTADDVLAATFDGLNRKNPGIDRIPEDQFGKGGSMYLQGPEIESGYSPFLKAFGDSPRIKEMWQEARRQYAGNEASMGVGDVGLYAILNSPMNFRMVKGANGKMVRQYLDNLTHHKLNNAMGRMEANPEGLHIAVRDITKGVEGMSGEQVDDVLLLVRALNEPRAKTNVRGDYTDDMFKLDEVGTSAYSNSETALNEFMSLRSEIQQDAINNLEALISKRVPPGKTVKAGKASAEEAARIHNDRKNNLWDIVAQDNQIELGQEEIIKRVQFRIDKLPQREMTFSGEKMKVPFLMDGPGATPGPYKPDFKKARAAVERQLSRGQITQREAAKTLRTIEFGEKLQASGGFYGGPEAHFGRIDSEAHGILSKFAGEGKIKPYDIDKAGDYPMMSATLSDSNVAGYNIDPVGSLRAAHESYESLISRAVESKAMTPEKAVSAKAELKELFDREVKEAIDNEAQLGHKPRETLDNAYEEELSEFIPGKGTTPDVKGVYDPTLREIQLANFREAFGDGTINHMEVPSSINLTKGERELLGIGEPTPAAASPVRRSPEETEALRKSLHAKASKHAKELEGEVKAAEEGLAKAESASAALNKSKLSAAQRTSRKEQEVARAALAKMPVDDSVSAYTNRNGLTFLADGNNLSGYSSLDSIVDAELAEVTKGWRHPIENSRIRRRNKAAQSINKISLDKRIDKANELMDMATNAAGGTKLSSSFWQKADLEGDLSFQKIGATKKEAHGVQLDSKDVLIHEGLAAIKSVEQKQFGSFQSFSQAMLKFAAFNKNIQQLQLAAGVSTLNAYTFRQALTAMMNNPSMVPRVLKAFFDARNSRSTADFYYKNQDILMRASLLTGDSMYMDGFAHIVSRDSSYSTNYITDMADNWSAQTYREVADKLPKEAREAMAKQGHLSSWRNAPTHDTSTLRAETRSAPSRVAWTVWRSVQRTFDEPTFQRFMPVLQSVMLMDNYAKAQGVIRKNLMKRMSNNKPLSPAEIKLTEEQLEEALRMAHVRNKLFWEPRVHMEKVRDLFAVRKGMGQELDREIMNRFMNGITDEGIREITKYHQGNNLGKILSSLFFALEYKSTQLGRILNGFRGVAQPKSFILAGDRTNVTLMASIVAAAYIYNDMMGRETAFDDLEKTLVNFNNLGKFHLGDGEGTFAIDPFFSQFTLLNSGTRMVAGIRGQEGGTNVGKTNWQRNSLPGPVDPVVSTLAENLLSPYKSVVELAMNDTYFGANIWEKKTLKDGTPNPNYDPLRNAGASIMHVLGLDTTNAWVKGENTTGDNIGWVGGSGLIQHEYVDAYDYWQQGDLSKALFEAMEMPVRVDNLTAQARNSLNTYVVTAISGYKDQYDKAVAQAAGDTNKIDAAYEKYVKDSIATISDWEKKHKIWDRNPQLIASAQRMITGFLSGEYDDNLNKVQNAFWAAKIESLMGDDFGFDMLEGESEEDYLARKDKATKFYVAQLDKEYEARQTLQKYGYEVKGFEHSDAITEYRNMHRDVIRQLQAALTGKVEGYKDLRDMKKTYEARIENIDSLYPTYNYNTSQKNKERKSKLANEYNQYVLDIVTPFVDKYGVNVLEWYEDNTSPLNAVSELIIPPVDKYYNGKDPAKSYLRDLFGVGYRDSSNLPTDKEVIAQFNKVKEQLGLGRVANSNALLDMLIEDIRRGRYGVSGETYGQLIHYKALLNGRAGL